MDETLYQSGELDFAFDTTFDRVVAQMAAQYGVHVKQVKPGVAHGWPTVVLLGTGKAIARAVKESWVSGDEETDAEILMLALLEATPLPPA